MILRIIIASFSFLMLFGVVEITYSRLKLTKELSRKLIHIFSSLILAVLPIWLNYYEIALVALLFVPTLYISKQYNIFKAIHTDERSTLGEVYYPIAIAIICLLKPSLFDYTFAVLVLGLADGSAAIVGKKYGLKHFSILGSHKTYLGSSVFALITSLIGFFLLLAFRQLNLLALVSILGISIVLTLGEAVSSNGLDNLIIPLTSLLLLYLVGLP